MVRAVLDGRKTQTRRVLRDQNPVDLGAYMYGAHLSRRPVFDKVAKAVIGHRMAPVLCPYCQPGDQLWVREAFRTSFQHDLTKPSDLPVASTGTTLAVPFWYDADLNGDLSGVHDRLRPGKYRPGMFMPRAASRLTLEVTSLRVERLQDISRGDAMAEGCPFPNMAKGDDPRKWYADLWEQINGTGSWSANPWVWCVSFKVVKP